jgi:hypothetical protein
VFAVLEIVSAYTNISFTEKQKDDPCKLYDLLVGNGLSTMIMEAIPTEELAELLVGIDDSINAIYNYRNSILGILDIVQNDYDNLKFDANGLQQVIADPSNLALLKDIMAKLG